MRLNKQERIVEEIALLLLKLELNHNEPDRTYEIAANEAASMAFRASKGWWEIAGRPNFNQRMIRLRNLMRRPKELGGK